MTELALNTGAKIPQVGLGEENLATGWDPAEMA